METCLLGTRRNQLNF